MEKAPRSRLTKDGYKKPKLTYTEKLTLDEIEDKLEDYVEVEDLKKVPFGTHMRYITKINGQNKFRMGGVLINTKGLPKYVILINNNGQSWSVQTKDTTFYRMMTREEIKEEYEEVIEELEGQIEKHLKTIDNLKALAQHYKDEALKPRIQKN